MTSSDPHAPESWSDALAGELRDAERHISASDAHHDMTRPNPGSPKQSTDEWDGEPSRTRRVS